MPSRIPRPLSPACGLHLLGSIALGDAACRDGGGGQLEMITAAKAHPLGSKRRDRGRAESQTHYIGAPEHYAQQNAVTAKREKRHSRPACTLPRPLGLAPRRQCDRTSCEKLWRGTCEVLCCTIFSLVHVSGGEHFRIMTRAAAPKSWGPRARRLHRDKTREEAARSGSSSQPLPARGRGSKMDRHCCAVGPPPVTWAVSHGPTLSWPQSNNLHNFDNLYARAAVLILQRHGRGLQLQHHDLVGLG